MIKYVYFHFMIIIFIETILHITIVKIVTDRWLGNKLSNYLVLLSLIGRTKEGSVVPERTKENLFKGSE